MGISLKTFEAERVLYFLKKHLLFCELNILEIVLLFDQTESRRYNEEEKKKCHLALF